MTRQSTDQIVVDPTDAPNATATPLARRAFGRLPFAVSPLGVGTYHLTSDRYVEHADAIDLLGSALGLGINVLDTAPMYGVGEAEQIVGEALGRFDGQPPLVIGKIGRFEKGILARVADAAYSDPRLMYAQLRHSLRVLNLPSLPLVLLHETDWTEWGLGDDVQAAPVWEFVRRAKGEGLIGAVGLSVRQPARAEALCATGCFDAMLFVHYHNLVWQRDADAVLRVARERGMGVAIGAPYRQGLLASDDPTLGDRLRTERRSSVPPGIVSRIEGAQRIAAEHGMTILELGIRWLAADDRVHTTLVGPRSATELTQNVAWVAKGPLPDAVTAQIAALADIPAGAWS